MIATRIVIDAPLWQILMAYMVGVITSMIIEAEVYAYLRKRRKRRRKSR